jgi:hypothetical protein
MDDLDESSTSDLAGIAACSKLISEALAQTTDLSDVVHPNSLFDIQPCIDKEALRHIGIGASDSVLEIMARWPRIKLYNLLKCNRLTVTGGTAMQPDAVTQELVDVLATILGHVYWAARNCNTQNDFATINRTVGAQIDTRKPNRRALAQVKVEKRIAKDRLMAVDLSGYDGLITYPTGRDWPLERKKLLFLQTAVRLRVEWDDVVRMTRPFFKRTLSELFQPVVVPMEIGDPFFPPPYDIARQTPQHWMAEADLEWKKYRDGMAQQISDRRNALIARGELKEFERRRKNSGVAGLKKAAIADERTAFEWAARRFFTDALWAEIAKQYPSPNQPRAKRRDQIRKRSTAILKDLGLPVRK